MNNIYQTQNRALAITLATCGVPFARDEEHGIEVPFVNIYDPVMLRKIKNPDGSARYKDWPFEKAARAAFRSGIQGLLVYNFQRNELCARVLKAYDRHSTALRDADQGGLLPPLTLSIEPEDAAVLCAQFTRNRNTFTHGWKAVRPFLHLPGNTEQRTEGGKTVILGSFRLVPLAL